MRILMNVKLTKINNTQKFVGLQYMYENISDQFVIGLCWLLRGSVF